MLSAGLMETTVRTRRYPVVRLARDLAGKAPSAVTSRDLEGWLARRSVAPETKYAYRSGIRAFFAFAHDAGLVSSDPSTKLPRIRRPALIPTPCPETAIRSALAAADDRTKLMILLAAVHGLRCVEIASVRGADMVSTPQGICLVITKGKGRKQRVAYLDAGEGELIRARRATEGGYLFPGQIDGHLSARYVTKLLARALPGDWTAHKLRTRFATVCHAANPNLVELAALLGHESTSTTQRYVALTDNAARQMSRAALL